jgi:hypothetical protein
MRKNLIFLISLIGIVALFSLSGCSNYTNNKTVNGIIDSYYKSIEPSNRGDLKIFAQKPIDDKLLVLAEKYSGDGHSFTELFLISNDKKIEKRATGYTPLSMCFTINLLEYEDNTIVFGNFNNSKWEMETDKKKPVNIQNILVKFKNGEIIKEDVGVGYIVYSNSLTNVEAFELYDNNGVLQSDLNDLRKYGSVFNETSFTDIGE